MVDDPRAAGECQRALTPEEAAAVATCRHHQRLCLNYLSDPAGEHLEMSAYNAALDTEGSVRGLLDWFDEELIITYPEHTGKNHTKEQL